MKKLLKTILPARLIRHAKRIIKGGVQSDGGSAPADDDRTVLRCRIAYNRFGAYCIPLSSVHRPAANAVVSGGVWEPDTIEFMISGLKHGDIVHAGTYFGDFLPALSRSRVPGAKIWAFEPNRENFRCAEITVQLNELGNVELLNAGLGAREDILPMNIMDEGGRSLGGSSRILSGATGEIDGACSVRIVALDDVVSPDRQVSILQLDVEGFEREALEGALVTIGRCRPVLILEGIPEQSWLERNILSLGYRATGRLHGNTVFRVQN